jgi:hypothetical protein
MPSALLSLTLLVLTAAQAIPPAHSLAFAGEKRAGCANPLHRPAPVWQMVRLDGPSEADDCLGEDEDSDETLTARTHARNSGGPLPVAKNLRTFPPACLPPPAAAMAAPLPLYYALCTLRL